jgi:steroid delta-isomerase-like uncharacterized protein
MSVDRNKATARRFFEEGSNRRDYAVFDEVLTPNWVYYGYSAAPAGMGGLKERLGSLFTAFPDYHVTIEDLIAEGDKVVVRYTARGTHRGVFLGTAPTGKTIVYQGVDILRFVDGQIMERWNCHDRLSWLQQVGIVTERSYGGGEPAQRERQRT